MVKKMRKIVSIILSLLIILSICPISSFAGEAGDTSGEAVFSAKYADGTAIAFPESKGEHPNHGPIHLYKCKAGTDRIDVYYPISEENYAQFFNPNQDLLIDPLKILTEGEDVNSDLYKDGWWTVNITEDLMISTPTVFEADSTASYAMVRIRNEIEDKAITCLYIQIGGEAGDTSGEAVFSAKYADGTAIAFPESKGEHPNHGPIHLYKCKAGTDRIDVYYPISEENYAQFFNPNQDLLIDPLKILTEGEDVNSDLYKDGWWTVNITEDLMISTPTVFEADSTASYAMVRIRNEIEDKAITCLYIQIGGEAGGTGDTEPEEPEYVKELRAGIESACALEASHYYTKGDRYNGNVSDTIEDENSGFWKRLESILEEAKAFFQQRDYKDGEILSNISEIDITSKTAEIADAVKKLVPCTQINATELYEAVHEAVETDASTKYHWDDGVATLTGPNDTNVTAVKRNNTTAASWNAYQAALAKGEAELAKLYYQEGENLPEGKKVGDATEYNSSTEGEARTNVEAAINAIESAVSGLERLADEYAAQDASMAYESLKNMTSRIFNPAKMSEEKYSDESWLTFITARDNALEFLKTSAEPAGLGEIGAKEVQKYTDAYVEFWNACYSTSGLTAGAESIGVTLYITDNFAILKEDEPLSVCGMYEITGIPAENSFDGVLEGLFGEAYQSLLTHNNTHEALGVYVNGIYAFMLGQGNSAAGSIGTFANYRQIRLQDEDVVVIAAMKNATYTNASGSVIVETASNLLGDVQYLEAERDGEVVSEWEVVSGEELGLKVMYSFALPQGFTGGRTGLANVAIYRSDCCASREEALRAKLTKNTGVVTDAEGEFNISLYSKSGESEGWYMLGMVSKNKNGGLANGPTILVHVKDSEDLGAVRADFTRKLDDIYTAYPNDFYNTEQLDQIRDYYEEGIAGISAATTSGGMAAAYKKAADDICSIQKTNSENTEASITAARFLLKRLPVTKHINEGKIYKADIIHLKLLFGDVGIYTDMSEYARSLFTSAEATRISLLKEAWNNSNQGENLPEMPAFELEIRVFDANTNEILAEEPKCYFGSGASVIGYSEMVYQGNNTFWWPPDSFILYDEQVGLQGDEKLSSITLPTENYKLTDMGIVIDSEDYEIKRVVWSAEEAYDISGEDYNLIDWVMLREDVTVDCYVSSSEEPDPATSVIAQLKGEYDSYNRAEYSAENWKTLMAAYNAGVEAIKAAADDAGRQSAFAAAVEAMNNVPKNPAETPGAIPNWGAGSDYDAGTKVGTVDVSVENNTFFGGAFTGLFVDKKGYAFGINDTMMTVVLRALKDSGYGWEGTGGTNLNGINDYTISYIAKITQGDTRLGEFDGDPGSGWMGTLNDWFTNAGFNEFVVEDGDEIKIMYTQNLGVDLGGSWGNSDTTLRALDVRGGTLMPAFSPGEPGNTYKYTLAIAGERADIKVNPTAANKNYLVKTFLNEKVTSFGEGNSFYKRTETIPVSLGDIIYIGVGERAWPSMNKQGAEARAYTGTWYELNVISTAKGAEHVKELIAALPAAEGITYQNYEKYRRDVEYARSTYCILDSSEQNKVSNIERLKDAEAKLAYFDEIKRVKGMLSGLIKSANATDRQVLAARSSIERADSAYKALTDEQKGYITVRDVANYNDLVARLALLTPDTTATAIEGVKEVPGTDILTPESEVVDGGASATVTTKEVLAATKNAKTNESGAVTIAPEGTEEAQRVAVNVPKAAAKSIAEEEGLALNVETPVGNVSIPSESLANVVEKAAGQDIAVNIEKKAAEDVKDESVDTSSEIVVSVTIISGGKNITSFGGKSITIDIPVGDKFTVGESYSVVQISKDGSKETLTGKCIMLNGKLYVRVSTNHLSTFVVLMNEQAEQDKPEMLFTDIEGHWATEGIQYVFEKGLMGGTGSGVFSPNVEITRGMLVTILYRMAGEPEIVATSPFTDVEDGKWYTKAIIWAAENDVVSGFGNGIFGPNQNITREQMAAILNRYAKYKGYDVSASGDLKKYSDFGAIKGWALSSLEWANGAGLINGRTATTIDPQGTTTRAEAATIIMRFMENVAQ